MIKRPSKYKRINGKVVRTSQPRQDLNVEIENIGGAYKKPKEQKPSGKYPALYYQEASGNHSDDRIRIIYPDGITEWRFSGTQNIGPFEDGANRVRCCWEVGDGKFDEQIQAMHKYDLSRKYAPAVFLGEIK